jgi:cytochrome c biogenesis protein
MTTVEDRLSTAPDEVEDAPDQRPPLPQLLRRGWRRLTSMRTALVLLFLLAVAAIPGSLLPQRASDLTRVNSYLAKHRTAGPVLDRLHMFDVFASPWFAAIYLLLMVSLIGCLVPRWKLHVKALLRTPPRTPKTLSRLPFHAQLDSALTPGRAVAEATKVLRRKGFRTGKYDGSVSAEKGYLRETGNLCFHVAIVALLVGIAYGNVYGYQADRVLVEAKGSPAGQVSQSVLTNTPGQYDDVKLGRFERADSLAPWSVRLDDFEAVYQPDSTTAKDYTAHVSVRDTPGGSWHPATVKVNHPLGFGATKLYLLNHGYAPVFRLRGPDGFTASQSVVCPALAPMTLLSRCAVVFADLPGGKAYGFDVTFAPTGQLVDGIQVTSSNPRLNNPDALVTAYTGDLGLTQEHSVYTLETSKATFVKVGNLLVKDPKLAAMALPEGYTLDITGIPQWASFETKRDPGKVLVLLAAITMIGGVLASLRVRRRRVWVRATGLDGEAAGSLVEVGGLARTDADGFAEEFPRLVARVAAAVGAREREPA